MKLTLALLLTLAATSILGTLIPQQENARAAMEYYGETLYRVFNFFDLFDMYHSWWFQVLLLLLTANLLVCSLERLSTTWRIVFPRRPGFNPERYKRQKDRQEFSHHRPAEELAEQFRPALHQALGQVHEERLGPELFFFSERYRWSRLGVYVVHLSVLLMLIGGLLGSLFGFEAFVTIVEGESTSQATLRGSGRSIDLELTIECEDFEVSFYESGQPKEYRSDLVLLQEGQTVARKSIVVNDPLRHAGLSIYQASYGRLPGEEAGQEPESVTLGVQIAASGKTSLITTQMGRTEELPADLGSLTLVDFKADFQLRGMELGPCLLARHDPPGKDSEHILLPLNYQNFDKMRQGAMVISVLEVSRQDMETAPEPVYYTGLQIKKDPGVWVVYSGFVLMIFGCIVSFFFTHQRICVGISPGGEAGSRVMVSGLADKNRLGMQRKVEKLTETLAATGKDTP